MFSEIGGRRAQRLALAALLVFATTALGGTTGKVAVSPALETAIGMPLSFELNQGQAAPEIKALSRGKGYGLLLTGDEVVLVAGGQNSDQSVLRFRMMGANAAAAVSGLDRLPGTVSYFVGRDPNKWRSGIATYAKIKYSSVYPGIDLVYYGTERELEYDYVVAPGADPSAIRFDVSGARKIRLTGDGDLALQTRRGVVLHRKPVVYQEVDGRRQTIDGHFVLSNHNEVSFAVGDYDRTRPLVIDPSLGMFTYFGGTGTDEIKSIAVTSPSGLTFYGGLTTSASLPGEQNTYGGGAADAFVSVTGPNAASVLLTLFLGGTGTDVLNGLALDPAPIPTYVAVTGVTNSTDFPTMNAAQPVIGGSYDGFVTKFNVAITLGVPTATMAFSTYLGGSNVELANGIATSNAATGSGIFVTGQTLSTDFPTLNARQTAKGGAFDSFLTKYNPDGTVAFSTYVGGAASETAMGVAVYNQSTPTVAAIPYITGTLGIASGRSLAFVFAFDATGQTITYSKTFGALTAATTSNGIAVDGSGNASITGQTNDPAFPVLNATQPAYGGGGSDAYVVTLDPSGNTLFATYVGGAGYDRAYGIAVDTFTGGNNNITIGGLTTGSFPVTAVQTTYGGGGADGFVVMLDGLTHAVKYSTYLGGTGTDVVYSVCVGSAHNARVGGITNSAGLATAGVAQPAIAGGYDGFIARITTTP